LTNVSGYVDGEHDNVIRRELSRNRVLSDKFLYTVLDGDRADELEKNLRKSGVRVFKNIHVSGHASLEDHRDMIELIKPKHIIPSHGDYQKVSGISELGKEIGYKEGKNIHYAENGDVIKL